MKLTFFVYYELLIRFFYAIFCSVIYFCYILLNKKLYLVMWKFDKKKLEKNIRMKENF